MLVENDVATLLAYNCFDLSLDLTSDVPVFDKLSSFIGENFIIQYMFLLLCLHFDLSIVIHMEIDFSLCFTSLLLLVGNTGFFFLRILCYIVNPVLPTRVTWDSQM